MHFIRFLILVSVTSILNTAHANMCQQETLNGNIVCAPQFKKVILPERLRVEDTVGLVAPSYRALDNKIVRAQERLENLGLKVKLGNHIYDDYFGWAGTAQERAEDLNMMFGDSKIKAIFAVRGGRGSYDILQYFDYDLIKKHPKILMGFSDITALLLAIYSETGLITFHGPMPGVLAWPDDTVTYIKRVLFDADKVTFANPEFQTINGGKARGRFFGGNIATLTSRCGTPNLPDFQGAILFLEDIEEHYHKTARCLSQLRDAGILGVIRGVVFEKCTGCDVVTKKDEINYTLNDLLNDHIKPLAIPVFANANIGHIDSIFPLPEGGLVEIDSDLGTITIIEDVIK